MIFGTRRENAAQDGLEDETNGPRVLYWSRCNLAFFAFSISYCAGVNVFLVDKVRVLLVGNFKD